MNIDDILLIILQYIDQKQNLFHYNKSLAEKQKQNKNNYPPLIQQSFE